MECPYAMVLVESASKPEGEWTALAPVGGPLWPPTHYVFGIRAEDVPAGLKAEKFDLRKDPDYMLRRLAELKLTFASVPLRRMVLVIPSDLRDYYDRQFVGLTDATGTAVYEAKSDAATHYLCIGLFTDETAKLLQWVSGQDTRAWCYEWDIEQRPSLPDDILKQLGLERRSEGDALDNDGGIGAAISVSGEVWAAAEDTGGVVT